MVVNRAMEYGDQCHSSALEPVQPNWRMSCVDVSADASGIVLRRFAGWSAYHSACISDHPPDPSVTHAGAPPRHLRAHGSACGLTRDTIRGQRRSAYQIKCDAVSNSERRSLLIPDRCRLMG
jgi:hypothetical protein